MDLLVDSIWRTDQTKLCLATSVFFCHSALSLTSYISGGKVAGECLSCGPRGE